MTIRFFLNTNEKSIRIATERLSELIRKQFVRLSLTHPQTRSGVLNSSVDAPKLAYATRFRF
jgi:hypothetical protein